MHLLLVVGAGSIGSHQQIIHHIIIGKLILSDTDIDIEQAWIFPVSIATIVEPVIPTELREEKIQNFITHFLMNTTTRPCLRRQARVRGGASLGGAGA